MYLSHTLTNNIYSEMQWIVFLLCKKCVKHEERRIKELINICLKKEFVSYVVFLQICHVA